MKALIDLSVVEKLKDAMRTGRLRDVPPRHRVEAIARGLGWNTHAALRAELVDVRLERDVSDKTFVAYLSDKGFSDIEPNALSEAISNTTFAVSFAGEIANVHAPYQVSPFVLAEGPSMSMSPEALHQLHLDLNGGEDPAEFFNDPTSPFAEIRKRFKAMFPPRGVEGEEFLYRLLSAHRRRKMN